MACVVLQSKRPFAMNSAVQRDRVSSYLHVSLVPPRLQPDNARCLSNSKIHDRAMPHSTVARTLEERQNKSNALLGVDDIDCNPCSNHKRIIHCHAPTPPCPEPSRGQVVVQDAPRLHVK